MNINKAIIEKLAEGDHNAFHQVFKAFYGKVSLYNY